MLSDLRRLHSATGATFIFVTHDQDEAMAVATQIAVMDQGRIQQIGTPEQLYRRPASPMVARFISNGLTVPLDVMARQGDLCRCQLDRAEVSFSGNAAPGPGWLCLHSEDLRVVKTPGHFSAEVLSQTFQNGRYLTHVLPQGIGIDTLDLHVDQPLATGTSLNIEAQAGWVIPRADEGVSRYETTPHAHRIDA